MIHDPLQDPRSLSRHFSYMFLKSEVPRTKGHTTPFLYLCYIFILYS